MSAREALAQKILARLSKAEGGSGGCGRASPGPVAMLALVGLLFLRVRLRRLASRRSQRGPVAGARASTSAGEPTAKARFRETPT
jgi:hypothetical protein